MIGRVLHQWPAILFISFVGLIELVWWLLR